MTHCADGNACRWRAKGSVVNAIAGTGWTDTAGTTGETDIAISTAGQKLESFKKVHFEARPDPDPDPDPDPEPADEGVKLHRLYNPNSGEHFFTASGFERSCLVNLGWIGEGDGWTAPKKSGTPVYRLYNRNGGEHHFTTSQDEYGALKSLGWTDEGIGWYSGEDKKVPVCRQFNPNAFACNHNFTASKDERQALLSLGWRDEGIGWYGI